ncbi:MAG: hypothetical protein FK734_09355 [Asgard group archaeon]|nr:hypothetical protein [Asgard group archaeon]
MVSRINRILMTFFVVAILPLTSGFYLTIVGMQPIDLGNNPITNYNVNFFEDFINTNYQDPISSVWGWGTGAITDDRNFSIYHQSFVATTFEVRDIDVQGRKVYAAQYSPTSAASSVGIFSIANPNNIFVMSTRSSFPQTQCLAVEGNTIYAGIGGSTYNQTNSYNATNPYNLYGAGNYLDNELVDGLVTDISIQGVYIYFTVYNSAAAHSLQMVYAENPDALSLMINTWTNSKALGLDVSGSTVYIAASTNGFFTLDVGAVKTNYVQLDYIDTPGNATDVVVDGGLAYLADGEAGVHIIDVHNPNDIQIIGTYDTEGYARKVALQGKTLYVADGPLGVTILDVANPENPCLLTRLDIGEIVLDVDLYGNTLVVATNLGIHTYEVGSDTGGITNFATSAFPNPFKEYEAWDVRVRGDVAYVAAGPDGFYTLDVRNPMEPILLDQINTTTPTGIYRKLDIRGNYAYLIDENGITVYDISDPTNIFEAHYLGSNQLTDVFIHGDILYGGWGGGSFFNIDISNPETFSWSDAYVEVFIGSNITSIWVEGYQIYSIDYIGGDGDGLFIHDLLDLYNPQLTAVKYRYGCYQWDVKADGDFVYIAAGNWLSTYNVTNPYDPVFINDVDLPGYINLNANGVWNFGPYLIGVGDQGAFLINSLNFAAYSGSCYPDAFGGLQVTTHGDYTYVANKTSLIILRHYESPADTYIDGTFLAQSLEIDAVEKGERIDNATLIPNMFIPFDTEVEFFMSADGGTNWEAVTPGVKHTFANPGIDLRWKAELSGKTYSSVHIYSVNVFYAVNENPGLAINPLVIGLIAGGAGALILIIVIIVALVSRSKKNKIPTR